MASSAHKHHIHLPNPYDSAATPPPTPSTQPELLSASDAADSISRLLHRLPPTLNLSLPTRRSPLSNASTTPPITTVAPLISFSDPTENLYSNIFSACSLHGFFQLIDHNIPSQLAQSAESESLSLFNLSRDQKHLQFPKNWPLGYDADDDDDDDEESTSACESFCLDSTCFAESTTALNLSSLHEFTGKLEKLGLNVTEALSRALGFENPAREDPKRICSLMWISENSSSINKPGLSSSGRMYPYVVGLQYQIRCQKYSLSADSGLVSVSPRVDSVLVTIGDIAQVISSSSSSSPKFQLINYRFSAPAGWVVQFCAGRIRDSRQMDPTRPNQFHILIA